MSEPERPSPLGAFPRVPAYAWDWLQRSRPVLVEAADRLVGEPPSQAFLEHLRQRFDADPFTRSVLIDVIADVAFNGRVPQRRPAGASWDRGLTWWAAALAGVSRAEFEARSHAEAAQRALFAPPAAEPPASGPSPARRHDGPPLFRGSAERRALAAALRELVERSQGGQIPVSAVRQLLAQLEDR